MKILKFFLLLVASLGFTGLSAFSLQGAISSDASVFYILLIAFGTGLLTSFTPCIYPMIPITIGILQSQASTSLFRNFLVAFSYVLGISTVYASLGYVAATSTVIFGQWLANPWLIFFMILLFIYLAFSMFGFYEIYMPKIMKGTGKQVSPKGSIAYSYLFGLISGAAASPCLTPALAILLGYVAKQGSPVLGFMTLFSFSLGMGVILVAIGTLSASTMSGKKSFIPRAGLWMNDIKTVFGFLLLGVCAYFLQPVLDMKYVYSLYALVGAVGSGYFFLKANGNKFRIALGVIFSLATVWIISQIF